MDAAKEIASPEQIVELIKRRKTLKVLGDAESCISMDPKVASQNDGKVLAAIKSAGWAPFHYNRDVDGIAEPWRVHVLWHQDCRAIAAEFHQLFSDVKASNKLPAMLAACGALVLVTWLPQFKPGFGSGTAGEDVSKENQATIDEEHLAATSAMVQNLLLILTAHGMGTYWSSGGQFRLPEMFARLGIAQNESLLSAIFVEYPETQIEPYQRLPGKQRENRSADFKWLNVAKFLPG